VKGRRALLLLRASRAAQALPTVASEKASYPLIWGHYVILFQVGFVSGSRPCEILQSRSTRGLVHRAGERDVPKEMYLGPVARNSNGARP